MWILGGKDILAKKKKGSQGPVPKCELIPKKESKNTARNNLFTSQTKFCLVDNRTRTRAFEEDFVIFTNN